MVVAGRRRGALRNQWTVVEFAKICCEHKDLNSIPGQLHEIKEIKVDRTCAGFLLPL